MRNFMTLEVSADKIDARKKERERKKEEEERRIL